MRYEIPNRRRVRADIAEIGKACKRTWEPAVLDEALDYLDGVDGHKIQQAFRQQRYGVGLRETSPAADTMTAVTTFTRRDVTAAIDAGLYETILTHAYTRIVGARASLFDRDDAKWEWDDEQIGEMMAELRSDGHAEPAFQRWDEVACALGSAVLHVAWDGAGLRYAAVPPQCVWVAFAEMISDTDGQSRRVDMLSLEDASCVVVQQAGGEGTQKKFLAYFGRSVLYPRGRCVFYSAEASAWSKVPEVGSSNASDWTTDGQPATVDNIANPLTLAQEQDDGVTDEYPVAVLYGSRAGFDRELLPASMLSLFEDCKELDLALGRVLTAAEDNAGGTKVFRNPRSAAQPETFTGLVYLSDAEQTFELKNIDTSNAKTAGDFVFDLLEALAEANGVPGHLVVRDQGRAPESGYALRVRYQPLLEERAKRMRLNAPAVARLWFIERALLNLHAGAGISAEVRQTYDPGSVTLPGEPKELLAELQQAQAAGLVDIIGAARRYHGFTSDQQAIEYLQGLQERSAQAKTFESALVAGKAAPEPEKPSGLLGLLKARQQRKPPMLAAVNENEGESEGSE